MAKFKRLSREDFLRIADTIRNRREEFTEIDGWQNAVAWTTDHAQIEVTISSMQTICKTLKIFPKLQERRPNVDVSAADLAALVSSHMNLLHDVGVTALPPVPVKNVTPSKDIAAANCLMR
jgi:hypothetical protein